MASVWKARQVSRPLCGGQNPLVLCRIDDIQRFREARAAAQLKHPGIVQVYDANFDSVYYFVMELVDDYTLGDLLRRKGQVSEEDS